MLFRSAAAAAAVAGVAHADRAVANEIRRRVNDAPLLGAYGRRPIFFDEK